MKRIDAIIRPNKLDDVKASLVALGVTGLTAIEGRGFGRQKGHAEMYRGTEYQVDFVPKIVISVLIADERLTEVTTAIAQSARTGEIGDGKIVVTSVEEVIRIRTGEKNAV
jgi:nitrogen regulatory protein P-II 1